MRKNFKWRGRLATTILILVVLVTLSGILVPQQLLAAPPATAPAAPEDLTGIFSNPASGAQIKLDWDDQSDNEVGFVVVRANNNQFTLGLKSWMTGPNVTSLVDDTIQPVGAYFYRVESFNAIGVSAWAPDALGLQVSTTNAQRWNLDSNLVLERSGTQSGQVDFLTGDSKIWLSDQPTQSAVTFPVGDWTVHLETLGWTGNSGIQIGESSGQVSGGQMDFTAFNAPKVIGTPDPTGDIIVTINAGGTVPAGHYLALKIDNSSSGSIITTGNSYLLSPASTPTYPIPEMPSSLLLVVGLSGLAALIFIGRKKLASGRT